MKKDDFFALFRLKLTERGVNESAAARIADNFLKRLDDEDEKMIEAVVDVSEIDQFTDEYIEYMRMRQKLAEQQKSKREQNATAAGAPAVQNTPEASVQSAETNEQSKPHADENFADSQASTVVFDKPVSGQVVDGTTGIPDGKHTDGKAGYIEADAEPFGTEITAYKQNAQKYGVNEQRGDYLPNDYTADEDAEYGGVPESGEAFNDEPQPTSTGKAVFIAGAIITLPVTVAFAAASLSLFVAVFAALAGMIILSIAAIVGGVAAGAVVAFIGIIYGITQIVAGLGPIGAYEIGIGLIITGIIMFGGILLYNFAVRFLPWVIKKVALLFGICVKGVKKLVNIARKECYKL